MWLSHNPSYTQTVFQYKCPISILSLTEPYVAFHKIVMAHHILRDILRLSNGSQTYNLEAFHSMLIHITPKSLLFSYNGMIAQ